MGEKTDDETVEKIDQNNFTYLNWYVDSGGCCKGKN